MPVDISERLSEIIPILSFLRELRSDTKPNRRVGLFYGRLLVSKNSWTFTGIVSSVALLGPLSYALLAVYEIGRLGYFGAPTDFIQLGSFGVMDVIQKVYLTSVPVLMMLALFYRIKMLRGIDQFYAILHAVGMLSFILAYLADAPKWKWAFGIIFALSALAGLFRTAPPLEIGNEEEPVKPLPESADAKFWRKCRSAILWAGVVFALGGMVAAAGAKDAAAQSYYWCVGEHVILGFYGDKVLMSTLSGDSIGPGFTFKDAKLLGDEMLLKQVGPLRNAPMWRTIRR